ncbi:hypothetical protein AAFF_G00303860 [Aldrovandia affinis]|uniref:Uncharacterized protein n=1 Tax=Aldrovandia affinis TaxID=143900 RepID=A0AAD7WRB2_9TELE|nr:hypothetical protein AAFF_G00303860 [Aldrovandia affinis]
MGSLAPPLTMERLSHGADVETVTSSALALGRSCAFGRGYKKPAETFALDAQSKRILKGSLWRGGQVVTKDVNEDSRASSYAKVKLQGEVTGQDRCG